MVHSIMVGGMLITPTHLRVGDGETNRPFLPLCLKLLALPRIRLGLGSGILSPSRGVSAFTLLIQDFHCSFGMVLVEAVALTTNLISS